MSKKECNLRSRFKNRASLARSKNTELSYDERLALSCKGKKLRKVDLDKVDGAGYIKLL